TLTVHISGSGFAANCSLNVKVIRPDGSVVTGDGTFTPGMDAVTTDSNGAFIDNYILDGVVGTYTVQALSVNDAILATVTFTDALLPGSFSATGSMTTLRKFHTATLLSNGKVLVTGGVAGSGIFLASAEVYDPATGTFSATGSMATSRYQHTATLLSNGK